MLKSKRKQLGQHFLKSQNIAGIIADAARITKKDTVLEVGTGHGILTPLLCQRAGKVISIEKDRGLYSDALVALSGLQNLRLVNGDGFEADEKFDVFVSNLPYSESRRAVEWLAQKEFSHGVIMVQKEFAEKLSSGGRQMRAVSAIASHTLEMSKVADVGKSNFAPPPKVDSVVLYIEKKNTLTPDVVKMVNLMFSYRRKTVSNIAKKFEKEIKSEKRVDELGADEVIGLAKKLI